MMAVTAFRGSVTLLPGTRAIRSAIIAIVAPARQTAGINVRWSDVFRTLRAKCGTAMPRKAIGPQKAVVTPASSEALDRIQNRAKDTVRPRLAA